VDVVHETKDKPMTTTTQIAEYRAATGSGRMTVDEDPSGAGYRFCITGKTNTMLLTTHEAVELANTILGRCPDCSPTRPLSRRRNRAR
jgi:hypothetical protein